MITLFTHYDTKPEEVGRLAADLHKDGFEFLYHPEDSSFDIDMEPDTYRRYYRDEWKGIHTRTDRKKFPAEQYSYLIPEEL